jgi:predicted transcriptional regulator
MNKVCSLSERKPMSAEQRRSRAGAGMASGRDKTSEQTIMLGLLDAVERGDVTQRRLSSELGIAVGLVNTYIKRCINKGLIKVQQIPSRRYAYYLTAKGFVEKSQLIGSYFVHSFDFFRRARASCETTLTTAAAAGHKRIGLAGANELTEIAIIVATDIDVAIVAVIDEQTTKTQFLGIPVIKTLQAASGMVDAVVITNLSEPQQTYKAAVATLDPARVYLPSVLINIIAKASRKQHQTKPRPRK